MSEVLSSGLSIPVAWIFCTGMNYSDPEKDARERLRRVSELPLGSIQSLEDIRVLSALVSQCARYLLPNEITPAMRLFMAHHKLPLRIAAE